MQEMEIGAAIDSAPISALQIQVLLLCGAVLFIDGFDTQAIGYVAPSLARELHLGPGALAPVLSAALVGLAFGALLLGPLADRLGRKRIILFSTVTFAIFTLAVSFARNVPELLVLRFATGLGLGGAMPNAVALTAEFSPARRRATMVMAMFCGFSLGAASGGFLAAALLPQFGWRAVFLAGGLAPLLLAPFLAMALPESIRFLALKDLHDGKVAAILARILSVKPGTRFVLAESSDSRMPVAALFEEGRAFTTLLLWVVFFMSLLDLYLLSNWLPIVLSSGGASIASAAALGALLQVGGIVGTFTLGILIDRYSYRALAVTYFGAAAAVAAIAYSSGNLKLAAIAIPCAGFCIVGGQIAANALASAFYPTAMRSSGVGWALGIGRMGSILGPLAGGAILEAHLEPKNLFFLAVVPALLAGSAALALARRLH